MSDETSCSSSAIAAPQDRVIAPRAPPGPIGTAALLVSPAAAATLRSAAQLAILEMMKSNIENLWNYNQMVIQSNLRHLDVVRCVMEAGSATEAARLLRVSQPAVSKTLAQVEDRLGFRLFTRDRGRLIATAEARALLPEIEKAFLAVDGVQRLASDLRDGRTGMVTLAAAPSLANNLLPAAISTFRLARPGATVIVQAIPNTEVVDLVADRRVDLGFVLIPTRDSATVAVDLCAADLVCVIPKTHALAALKSVRLRDLHDVPLITFARRLPLGALIASAFERARVRPQIAVEVTQSATAFALVKAGAGIAIMDSFALLDGLPPNLITRPIQPAVRVVARQLSARDRPQSLLASAFVKDVVAIIEGYVARGVLSKAG
jgi:DNA-binding transcriptional LysR family regulator